MRRKSKTEQKKKIRDAYLEKRNRMEPEKRAKASEKIKEWVFANKRFKAAQTVFVYSSFKSEVETKKMIQGALRMGKRVAIPRVNGAEMDFYEIQSWEDLFPGYQGILEPQISGKNPVIPNAGDVMLLPGSVFDLRGGRVGYGKGYYDRYLEKTEKEYGYRPYLMALGFACQIYPGKIPLEEHDKKMDCILTERRVIMSRGEKRSRLDFIADVAEAVIEIGIEFVCDLLD